jgi:uncharacterized alpha-E superfamily protein
MWQLILKSSHRTYPEESIDLDAVVGRLDDAVLAMASLSGLMAENMTRGMGWRFLEIGRRIERSIVLCTYVETLFGGRPSRVELSVRLALELCDSFITHRKRYPMDPYTLAAMDVVLTDRLNPRSLIYQLETLRAELDGLIGHDPLAEEKTLIDQHLDALRGSAPFANAAAGDLLSQMTTGSLACRTDLARLSDMLTRSFFSHAKGTVLVGLQSSANKVAS